MKSEAQQIAIAEACGFTVEQSHRDPFPYFLARHGVRQGANWRTVSGAWSHGIPDYLVDLNAMHEAEKVISEFDFSVYYDHLKEVTGSHCGETIQQFEFVHATAAQRAEAFLRTLNLWVE